MNLQEIETTINELELGDTNFTTCEQLASLYIVKQNFAKQKSKNGLNEILPWYNGYVEVKCKYAKHEVTDIAVCEATKAITKEFLRTLYSNVDTETEKQIIKNLFTELQAYV